jgi:redox-sensitive bicupin YhaK (pirin superfamily)
MITTIPAEKRYKADHGWLTSYHLFSFADYYDPQNMDFGVLRVMNDDEIAPESGFGEHSHDNMEIVTIVWEGELTHKDNIGNSGVIRAGEVQYMSAGTGVQHEELNESFESTHLYQIWIMPRQQNFSPQYEQKDFSDANNANILLPIASGEDKEGALAIRADATIYTSLLDEGKSVTHDIQKDHGVFIYVRSGALSVNGVELKLNDQARITNEELLTITASEYAEFLLINVAL